MQKFNRYKRLLTCIIIGFIAYYALKKILTLTLIGFILSVIPYPSNHGHNILVVGTDNWMDQTHRSDTIAVIHINTDESKISILSIPRDTRVTIEPIGVTKINHAFAHGGIDQLKKTVSEFLSIPIHNHVVINETGIETLIDAIGGLTVTIDTPMKYDDFAANLHIQFDSGTHHLNGKKTIEYLRFRHDTHGDIGRISRQQAIMKEIFNQAFTLKTLLISPKLLHLFFNSVETDLSLLTINNLINQIRLNADSFLIETFNVPGSVRLIDGISFWRPNILYLDNIITRAFSHFSPNTHQQTQVSGTQIERVASQLSMDKTQNVTTAIKLEILNGNGIAGIATETANLLSNHNLTVSKIGNSQSFDYNETILVDWKGNLEKSLFIAQLLNISPENIIKHDRQNKPIDVTLVTGKDWTIHHVRQLYEPND